MIPTQNDIATKTSSNLGSQKLMVDEDSAGFLVNLLINLYADPLSAAINEALSNAIDATAMSGSDAPVEVTVNQFENKIKIQDLGLGMSKDEVLNTFCKLLASSKRETNEAIGMMGVGGKAPLAYADSFVVTAIKDGRRTDAVVARNGATILGEFDTSDANGVRIEFPLHPNDIDAAKDVVRLFSRYCRHPVKLNGQQEHFECIDKNGIRISTEGSGLIQHHTSIVVVMGGMHYSVDPYYAAKAHNGSHFPESPGLVFDVPIGSLEVTPSRESLLYSPRTLEGLDKHVGSRVKEVWGHIRDGLNDNIQKCDSWSEVEDAIKTWGDNFGEMVSRTENGFSWRGKPILETYESAADFASLTGINSSSRTVSHIVYYNALTDDRMADNIRDSLCCYNKKRPLLVTNAPKSFKKNPIKAYLKENNYSYAYVGVDPTHLSERMDSIDYADLPAAPAPSKSEKPVDNSFYWASSKETSFSSKEPIPDGYKKIYYFIGHVGHQKTGHIMSTASSFFLNDDEVIACVSKTDMKKFLKAHPKAVILENVIDKMTDRIIASDLAAARLPNVNILKYKLSDIPSDLSCVVNMRYFGYSEAAIMRLTGLFDSEAMNKIVAVANEGSKNIEEVKKKYFLLTRSISNVVAEDGGLEHIQDYIKFCNERKTNG